MDSIVDQRPQIQIKPKVTQPSIATIPDKNQLLLLGLQLLNKGLNNNNKLPCAVVKPTVQSPNEPTVAVQLQSVPASPQKCTSDSEESNGGNRKRKRNSNNDLSVVEKREKRKMMNRVAAQNARDRKKAYVEDLEQKIAKLEEKNKQLEQENRTLKHQTANLSTEKEKLEKKMAESSQTDFLQAFVKGNLMESLQGSAAPRVSLQQKQLLRVFLSDLLASLFPQDVLQTAGTTVGSNDRSGVVTWESHDPIAKQRPTTPETTDLVGGQRNGVESTQDMSPNHPGLPTVASDSSTLGFGGNVRLNPVLDTTVELHASNAQSLPSCDNELPSFCPDDFFSDPQFDKLLNPLLDCVDDNWNIDLFC